MKNITYTLVLFCILLLSNCKQAPESGEKGANTANAEKGLPSVEVVNPTVQSFTSSQTITGNIRADQSVQIHAMEQGVVRYIHLDLGDEVKRGQTIAQLSNPMISIRVKEVEAMLLEEKANLLGAQAEAKMSQAKQLTIQSLYNKISDTYSKSSGLITIIELENAKRDVDIANAQTELSTANVNKYMAKVSAMELNLEGVRERLNMLRIVAPFSGVVTGRYVDRGTMIQNALSANNANPIISIASIDPVRLVLPIPESDISGIKKGDEVEIEFPSLATANIKASISRISRSLDPKSKTMEVQIDIPNKNGDLKTGMYAKARIARSSSNKSLSLPNAAIQMKKDAPYIYLVKDGIVQELKLKKGLSGKDFFQVLNSDVDANSQIIVKGKSMVKSGQAVQAILK